MRLIMMTNRRWVVCLLATAAIWSSLATAQKPQSSSSSTRSGPDPLQTATKPLTPKSSNLPPHKSSAVPSKNQAASGNTSVELSRLERTNAKSQRSKPAAAAPKSTSAMKSADTASGNGSKINFRYQAPAGGMKASTPRAQSANSSTPRVTKKN
jgi:hypothetical protein